MSENAKIRINFTSGEIEICGTEDFVVKNLEKSRLLLEEFFVQPKVANPLGKKKTANIPTNDYQESLPNTFGAYLNKFPKTTNNSDQALIAGYYIQKQSDKNIFKTSEVNKQLKEQGIKLTNAADTLRKLCNTKKIFVNEKSGKLSLYRIAKLGEDYIQSLLKK